MGGYFSGPGRPRNPLAKSRRVSVQKPDVDRPTSPLHNIPLPVPSSIVNSPVQSVPTCIVVEQGPLPSFATIVSSSKLFNPGAGKNSLQTLYYTLVYSYLYYCACVWGLTYQSNLKRLVILQKRAVRTISRSAFDAHSDPIFKSLKLLKLENIVFLQVAKVMYIYKNGQSLKVSRTCSYNTRNKFFFRLPSCRTNVRKFSLRFQGPKIFNSINDEIKNSLSLREFTSKLKSTFLD